MSLIKSKEDIAALRAGGRILARVLSAVADAVHPGLSTADLDVMAEKLIRDAGGTPAFKGYKAFGARTPYPATLCTSVNDEVVHGIPSSHRILAAGDIIGLDIGMQYQGRYTDMAVSVAVGHIDDRAEKLIAATKKSLDIAISKVHAGVSIGDIGDAVQTYIEAQGFGIVRDLVGHGVGHEIHEDPVIPNFGKSGQGPKLQEGMVIALEPMVTEGSWRVKIDADEWTWRTKDGSRAAHFEHTILVTKNGAEVLTA